MDKNPENNRIFAELVGLCWHETIYADDYYSHCSCGEVIPFGKSKCQNPNYATDPRLVLREMKYKTNFQEFLDALMVNAEPNFGMIKVDYILDLTGKLRDAAIKFMEGLKNK